MKPSLRRAAGGLLLLTAIFGWILSMTALFWVWRARQPTLELLTDTVDLLDQTLQTSSQLLDVTDTTLEMALSSLEITRVNLEDVATALRTTTQVTETTSRLIGQDLTSVVEKTQTALTSVRASALLIDDTLRIITRLPLIGARYAPEKPLGDSIAEVSSSLEEVPESLKEMGKGLSSASKDLDSIQVNLDALSSSLKKTSIQIDDAKTILSSYKAVLDNSKSGLSASKDRLVKGFAVVLWGISFFLVWLLIAQIGLALQGLDLLRRKNE